MDETLFLQIGIIAGGVAVCTAGGLLMLAAVPERPVRFLLSYVGAIGIFLGGLALILWFQTIASYFEEAG